MTLKIIFILLILIIFPCANAYTANTSDYVIVYSSVDQEFSEPILKQFEKQSGIKVKAVYDAEASKTVGLERRLISEKSRPKADVFWNSEHLRTFKLASLGVLAPYASANAKSIPASYRAGDNLWTGFGIRARVFIVNNKLVPKNQMPAKLTDLADPKWKGKIVIAKPTIGTTSTHFASLYARMGEKKYIEFLKALKANHVAILPGNSDVKDAVVAGKYAFGLTDSDDVFVAQQKKAPVSMVYPDQGGEGSFEIIYTVSMIKGGPNPENAKKLIDYLTSPKVAQELIASGAVMYSVQQPVSAGTKEKLPKFWRASGNELLKALEPSAKLIRAHLD